MIMKAIHYILAVLVFFAMAVSVSHGAFIFVAMALYLIQMVLIRKKEPSDEHIDGGGEAIDEPGGPIKDLPGKNDK